MNDVPQSSGSLLIRLLFDGTDLTIKEVYNLDTFTPNQQGLIMRKSAGEVVLSYIEDWKYQGSSTPFALYLGAQLTGATMTKYKLVLPSTE